MATSGGAITAVRRSSSVESAPKRRSVTRRIAICVAVCLVTLLPPAQPGHAGSDCPTVPTYDVGVPPPELLVPGFGDRPATPTELNAYVDAVDQASERVASDTFARSWAGEDLNYAFVGTPEAIQNLDGVAARQRALRNPATSATEVEEIARDNPAIVWYVANSHAIEMSGADAALRLLYELASRTDCEVRNIVDNLVVGIVPTLNPDGRNEGHLRGNHYGFDLNRDFFALTQPEMRGMVDLLREYPPLVLMDAHETNGTRFFSSPGADPVFHELPDAPLEWTKNITGPAVRAEFEARRAADATSSDNPLLDPDQNWTIQERGIGTVYDAFFQGVLDGGSSTAFGGAGILFEKGIVDAHGQKVEEQFVAAWVHLREVAGHKAPLLREYHESNVRALQDGEAGRLEPNMLLWPDEAEGFEQVPDLTVRHYFLPGDSRESDVSRLIERLLAFDVDVYRLTDDLAVSQLYRYGERPPTAGLIPAGSYWIPLHQPQKRWIETVLGEDTYTPIPTPDGNEAVGTAWSLPLLMNIDGSFTGDVVTPVAEKLSEPPAGRIAGSVDSAQSFYFSGDTGSSVAAALALARDGLVVSRAMEVEGGVGPVPRGGFIVTGGAGIETKLRTAAERYRITIRAHPRELVGGVPFTQPKVAVYAPPGLHYGYAECFCVMQDDSFGAARYLLDRRWEVPYTALGPAEIEAGTLTLLDFDVLFVSGGSHDLLAGAAEQVRAWVQAGGTLVATGFVGTGDDLGSHSVGGTRFAIDTKLSSSTQSPATARFTGNLVRAELDVTHPLSAGAGDDVYSYVVHADFRLTPGGEGKAVAAYPADRTRFTYSGFIGDTTNDRDAAFAALGGGAVLVDEPNGNGRVVVFAGEPNYRAYTEGMQLLLANALVYPSLN